MPISIYLGTYSLKLKKLIVATSSDSNKKTNCLIEFSKSKVLAQIQTNEIRKKIK